MIGPADLAPLTPELCLLAAALAILLAARRIRAGPAAPAATLIAALGAGLLAARDPRSTLTGFGGFVALDGYARFFVIATAAVLALTTFLSARSLEEEHVPRGEYHALLLFASAGIMLAASARDLITLYLAIELMTLCSYILVGITVRKPTANEAAIKYFLLGSFASALLLFGISLTYGLTGSTELASIAAALPSLGERPLLVVAIGLVGSGLAFKIAAVPFHSWAPDAYQGASAPVAAFLAAGSKAAGLAALGRVAWVGFGSRPESLSPVLMLLAALSLVVGSVLALPQTDMKRLLAYSSIAHAGYALLGISAGSSEGVSATMTYAFLYAFMTLGAFGVVAALGERGGELDGYRGLGAQRPAAALLMLVFLLSLTGIPPTAGFAAKFAVIRAAVGAGHTALAVLAVVCTAVTAFVYMRVAVLMYMRDAREPQPRSFPLAVSAALGVAALVTLLGGILPGVLTAWAQAP